MTEPPDPIVRVHYQPSTAAAPFEILDLAALIDRVGVGALQRYERIDFDLVVVCTGGRGTHEVDFETIALEPQRVLHVRPGQVHRWMVEPVYDALVLLFADLGGVPALWESASPVVELTADEWHDLDALLGYVRRERRSGPVDHHAQLALQTLLVRALRLDRRDAEAMAPSTQLYADFRAMLDADGQATRSVEHYAGLLGCSGRTLTRACRTASGNSAKQILDERAALQARRLLALPGRTVASVGFDLGFSEASNFVKFFKRVAGDTPATWQAAYRAGAPTR